MSVANIALEDKRKLFEKAGTDPCISDYKEIYYGPSLIVFVKHIFQTFWYLQRFKKAGHQNLIYFYGEVDIKNFFFVGWARWIGYKVIIDIVEDLEAYTSFKSFKNRLKYRSAVFFRRYLDAFADGFTVVSRILEEKIRRQFFQKPVFFLPVTINKYLINPGQESAKAGTLTVFYSGSFNEKDGLSYLLQGLASAKEGGMRFKLMLSGRGTGAEMQRFWTDVNSLGLADYIDYKGVLPREEYIRTLNDEVDILCMTRVNSRYANAGFPFKLGEFLFTGKPVIASRVGDVEKYLTNCDAYLVEPENARQITEALQQIASDRSAATRTGLNGREAALRYFDHELYAPGLRQFMLQTV